MNRLARPLSLFAFAALAPLAACSSSSDTEATSRSTSALDPNQVIPAQTAYSIELTSIQVLDATEPYTNDVLFSPNTDTYVPVPQNPICGAPWTPDTGYIDWAQLGLKVVSTVPGSATYNAGNPDVTACSLGPAPTGAVLQNCQGGAYNNGVYNEYQPLARRFTVNAGDQISFALAVDNIESADVTYVSSSMANSLVTGLKQTGDIGQLVGALVGVAGALTLNPALGAEGGIIGMLGNGAALGSDLLPQNDVSACDATSLAEVATSCVGGLMGNPPGNPPINPFSDAPDTWQWSYAGMTPDTLWIVDPATGNSLTAEQLQNITSVGPATFVFTPTISDPTGRYFTPTVPRSLPSPAHMFGCSSSLKITLTIARDWTTGPAASSKSADMAVVRSPGTIDNFASSPSSFESQLVHDWGQGDSFSTELEAPAEALETAGVSLTTSPALVSRSEANLDMFYVDSNGGLYTVYQAAPDYTWHTKALVSPGYSIPTGRFGHVYIPSIAPANAFVTATARSPENLDAFFIGSDGNVYNTYWNSGMGATQGVPNWGAAFSITSQACIKTNTGCAGSASPGGGIAAVSRNPSQLDVFYVGKDGGIWNSYWYAGAPSWTTMEIYGPASQWQYGSAFAGAGAVITAAARTSEALDVFVIGSDGGMWKSSWVGGGSWGTAEVLLSARTGQPGGPISVVSRQPDALDVVYQGVGNALEWASWTNPAPWQVAPIPAALGISTSMVGRGGVSIVAPTSFSLQAFYLNAFHQVNTVTWNDPSECNTLSPVACSPSQYAWTGETTLPVP
jgi:hypothetical protein